LPFWGVRLFFYNRKYASHSGRSINIDCQRDNEPSLEMDKEYSLIYYWMLCKVELQILEET